MTSSKYILPALAIVCLATISYGVTHDVPHQQLGFTTVYIVRHAEKTSERSNANLTKEGKSRAEVLKWMLRDVSLDAIYTTDTTRTRQTVQPTATAKELKLTLYTPKPGKLAETIIQQHVSQTLLVCGHSNTVPELLRSLGVSIKENILKGYDDLFIVTIDNHSDGPTPRTHLQRLHYPDSR